MVNDIEAICKLYNVSHETFEKLKKYEHSLKHWNKKINLISSAEIDNLWHRHIQDCLMLVQKLEQEDSWSTLVDLGSGNGFPGIILSIFFPHKKIILTEKIYKKTQFLKYIKEEINLNIKIYNDRIEDIPSLNADIITARAFANLNDTIYYSMIHGVKNYIIYSFKGSKCESEIELASVKWSFETEKFINPHINNCSLLRVSQVKPKDQEYEG